MDFTSGSDQAQRDRALALLLSGQKSTIRKQVSPPPTTRRRPSFEPWTDGKNRAVDLEPEPRLSPVTPVSTILPLDADVRLVEITAGLVAASDKERRQTDTIRRLALQLERSQKQIMELKNNVAGNYDASSGVDEYRRKSSRRRGASADDMAIELEKLRRERKEWMKKERSHKKDTHAASIMLSDIVRTADRVLAEKNMFLRRIATLQQQLYEAEHREDETGKQTPNKQCSSVRTDISPLPRPAFSQTSQSSPEGNTKAKVSERSTVRRIPDSPQSERTTRQLSKKVQPTRTGSLPNMLGPRDSTNFGKLESDNGLSGHNRNDNVDETRGSVSEIRGSMFRDMEELITENKEMREQIEELKEQLEARSEEKDEEDLEKLDGELIVLESVVEMMELSLSTGEAKEMQQTMSTIGLDNIRSRRDDGSKRLNVEELAERVKEVRESIATKYGQYLADFQSGSDESISLPPGATLQSMPNSTDMSLSRTVPPSAAVHISTPLAAIENNPEMEFDESISLLPGATTTDLSLSHAVLPSVAAPHATPPAAVEDGTNVEELDNEHAGELE